MHDAERRAATTPDERIAALCARLTNYERDRPDAVRFDLASMRALLERPDAPPLPPRLVQVGGSKGKGTTARYLAALAPAGTRTGVYSSPHVETVLERVSLDRENVEEDVLAAELSHVLGFAERNHVTVSFFEAMTAAALGCFARHGVELGLLEVGLGGRLDATTAVPVDASVITSIELEHTELLGDTIEAIAAEKAHVLRAGKPGFVALDGSALDVVVAHARAVGCGLQVLGRDFGVRDAVRDGDELVVTVFVGVDFSAVVRVAGGARYEAAAVALAIAVLRSLDPAYEPPARIARPAMPGCFERLGAFVLDGAHTPRSAALLAAELEARWPDARYAILFASAAGKRWRESLACLLPRADRVVVTTVAGTKSEDPAAIVDWVRAQGVDAESAADAVEGAARLDGVDALRVVTGSFYLVGSVRAHLRGRSPGVS